MKGEAAGGSGFFVAVASARWPDHFHHIHGIANWHVAVNQGFPVIRLNNLAGGTEIIDLDCAEWYFRPKWHDICVTPPLTLDRRIHKAEALVATSFCISEDDEAKLAIDAGDDVFMIGRFVDSDGLQTNRPALRFGHISISSADVEQPTGFVGRSIVVDMHSRTGFSGSPVFVFRTPGSTFPEKDVLIVRGHMMRLLGIHWGQFPEVWEIKEGKAKVKIGEHAIEAPERYIEGLSGMTCVCPSSAILELLSDHHLRNMRNHCDQHIARSAKLAADTERSED